mgnify:CR=1 FL=1
METIRTYTEAVKPERYGLPWTDEEYAKLKSLWLDTDWSFAAICKILKRPETGVAAKLQHMGYIYNSSLDYNEYEVLNRPSPLKAEKAAKEPTNLFESKIMFEVKTFINEQDASKLSDTEIFKMIAAAEKNLESFKNLKTSSKKKDAAIAQIEADLAKMAEYLDSRP